MHLFLMGKRFLSSLCLCSATTSFAVLRGAFAVLRGAFPVPRSSFLDARGAFPVPRSFLDSCNLDLRRLFELDECFDEDLDLALFL